MRRRGGGDDETVSTGCEPPGVLRLGCCCYICNSLFILRRAFCPLEGGGGGGGRHTGTRLTLEIRAQGLSNNQMLESCVCCHSKQTSALFLSESSFIDGEEKLHTIAFYFM